MNTYNYFGNATAEQEIYADAHLYRHKLEDAEEGIANAYTALIEKNAEVPEELSAQTAENLSSVIMTITGVEGNYCTLNNLTSYEGSYYVSYEMKTLHLPTVTSVPGDRWDENNTIKELYLDNCTSIGNQFFYNYSALKVLSLLSMTKEYVISNISYWFVNQPSNLTIYTSDYPDGFIWENAN